LVTALLVASCGTVRHAYVDREELDWEANSLPVSGLVETIFLIGDAGEPDLNTQEPTLRLLQQELQQADSNSTVIFLGDNLYTYGLPKKDDPTRHKSEAKLLESLKILDGYAGKPYFIPGNHDWNNESAGGRKAVKRMEDYIETYLGKGNTFLPDNACGDPNKEKLHKDLVLIFIDTHWWLHDWSEEKGMNKKCEVKTRWDFIELLEEKFARYKNDQKIVLMHHPFYSNGNHGGYFSAKQHLFPLTQLHKNLYIPLPFIGSLEPLVRKVTGTRQDIRNAEYTEMKNAIIGLLDETYKDVIFVSGHEHNLQYFKELEQHFIVSGGGSKASHARKGNNAVFAHQAEGYAKLYYYESGEVWLEFVTPEGDGSSGEIKFRKQIVAPKPEKVVDDQVWDFPDPALEGTTVGSNDFKVSKFSEFWMGENYRRVWETPVTAPSLLLDEVGLVPVKKGGGNGTNSLRLVDTLTGHEYALRSIAKDPLKSIPEDLRGLKAIRMYLNYNANRVGSFRLAANRSVCSTENDRALTMAMELVGSILFKLFPSIVTSFSLVRDSVISIVNTLSFPDIRRISGIIKSSYPN